NSRFFLASSTHGSRSRGLRNPASREWLVTNGSGYASGTGSGAPTRRHNDGHRRRLAPAFWFHGHGEHFGGHFLLAIDFRQHERSVAMGIGFEIPNGMGTEPVAGISHS